MLPTLRRCTASLPRVLAATSRPTRSSLVRHIRSEHLQISTRNIGAQNVRAFACFANARQQAATATAPMSDSADPILEFQELETRGLVHPSIVRTITRGMGLTTMTDVQTATINEALAGDDIIAQARTGTGKTLAFLVPILQRIIAEDPTLATNGGRRSFPDDIRAIVISPTRELAEQIATEARRITHNSGVIVQTAVGGTQKREMLQMTQRHGCHILVATPGRLADLLSDPHSGIRAPKLSMWVLDEADRLLDEGFWAEIRRIEGMLPDRQENEIQSMMFSATVPKEVVSAVRSTLRPGFRFVKCVRDDEAPTHERVPQKLIRTAGLQNHLPAFLELAMQEIEKNQNDPTTPPFKAIVYFNSTAMVELTDHAMRNLGRSTRTRPLGPAQTFSIHSKLTQSGRTRASEGFRRAKCGILLSSDVTARGMDFPDVTHVIQMGIPMTADIYVHRIGRTARAGKAGTGMLFVTPMEELMAKKRLGHLPLKPDESLAAASVNMTQAGHIPARVASILSGLTEAYRDVPRDVMAAAYRSILGGFQWLDDKQELINAMNQLSRFGWNLSQPPQISPVVAQKLGLSRVRGLNLSDEFSDRRRTDSGRSRGFGGGRPPAGDAFGDKGDAFDRAGYGGQPNPSYGGQRDSGYGGQRDSGYGGQRDSGYGGQQGYGYGAQRNSGFGQRQQW